MQTLVSLHPLEPWPPPQSIHYKPPCEPMLQPHPARTALPSLGLTLTACLSFSVELEVELAGKAFCLIDQVLAAIDFVAYHLLLCSDL